MKNKFSSILSFCLSFLFLSPTPSAFALAPQTNLTDVRQYLAQQASQAEEEEKIKRIIQKAHETGKFQILELYSDYTSSAFKDLGGLIPSDESEKLVNFSFLVSGARHLITEDPLYPYKRKPFWKVRIVAIEGLQPDQYHLTEPGQNGEQFLYISWDFAQDLYDRFPLTDEDSERIWPQQLAVQAELAQIMFTAVTEPLLATDIQAKEGVGAHEARLKAKELLAQYGSKEWPLISAQRAQDFIAAHKRLQGSIGEWAAAKMQVPAEGPLRDFSTTQAGKDLQMDYEQHEAIIDTFIQRAAEEGKIEWLSPRSPPALQIKEFLIWLGDQTGHAELPALFEQLLTTPKGDSPTQVKVVYASETNPLPSFQGETIVGHAGDHGIYAFVGDGDDAKLVQQRLVHEFGSRLGFPRGTINPAFERAFAVWRDGLRLGAAIEELVALINQETASAFTVATVMPKTADAQRDYAAAQRDWDKERKQIKQAKKRLGQEARELYFKIATAEQRAFIENLEKASGYSFSEIAAELFRACTFAATHDSTPLERLGNACELLMQIKPRLSNFLKAESAMSEILTWIGTVGGSYELPQPTMPGPSSRIGHLKALTDLLDMASSDTHLEAVVRKLGQFKAVELLLEESAPAGNQIPSICQWVEEKGSRASRFPFVDLAAGSNAIEYPLYVSRTSSREVIMMDQSIFMESLLQETVRQLGVRSFTVLREDVSHFDRVFPPQSIGTLMLRAVGQYVAPRPDWYQGVVQRIVPGGKIVFAIRPMHQAPESMTLDEFLSLLHSMTWAAPHSDHEMIQMLRKVLMQGGEGPWKCYFGHRDSKGNFVKDVAGYDGRGHYSETFIVFENTAKGGVDTIGPDRASPKGPELDTLPRALTRLQAAA